MPRVVCVTAKVRFFKQITTPSELQVETIVLFVILQKYDFSSKSQQQNLVNLRAEVVCDTAKVRFFKQITTQLTLLLSVNGLFVILQKYDFSSKSQHDAEIYGMARRCLWYCKSTIFQANHNELQWRILYCKVVCDTAKVRFFKQITTNLDNTWNSSLLFVILQKYDFSSKSQRIC